MLEFVKGACAPPCAPASHWRGLKNQRDNRLSICKLVVNLTIRLKHGERALATNSKSVDALTAIILSVFRLNARLLEQGDKLVKPALGHDRVIVQQDKVLALGH